jgi:hypothetical protein
MRTYLRALAFAATIAPGCQKVQDSSLKAIVSASDNNAFGFLPVRRAWGVDVESELNNKGFEPGREYMRDLTRETVYYALVECDRIDNVTAADWFACAENLAMFDIVDKSQLFVDQDQKLVAPLSSITPPDQVKAGVAANANAGNSSASTASGQQQQYRPISACHVANIRLLPYLAIQRTMEIAYKAKGALSKDMYLTAQALYLSLRGPYTDDQSLQGNDKAAAKRAAETASKEYMIPLTKMFKDALGTPFVSADDFVGSFMAKDGDFNPCSRTPPTGDLPKEALQWRNANFRCVAAGIGSRGAKNFLPTGTATYEGVRKLVTSRLDEIYKGLSVKKLGLTSDNSVIAQRDRYFDLLTDTSVPIKASQVHAALSSNAGDTYADPGDGGGSSFGLLGFQNVGCGIRPRQFSQQPVYQGAANYSAGRQIQRGYTPQYPGVAAFQNAYQRQQYADFRPWDSLSGAYTGSNYYSAGRGAPITYNDGRATRGAANINNNLQWASTSSRQLAQDVSNGMATGRWGDARQYPDDPNSPYLRYVNSDNTEFMIHKTSGALHAYTPSTVDGRQVSELDTFPHVGPREGRELGEQRTSVFVERDRDPTTPGDYKMALHLGRGDDTRDYPMQTGVGSDGQSLVVLCNPENRNMLATVVRDADRLADNADAIQRDPYATSLERRSAAADMERVNLMDSFVNNVATWNPCGEGILRGGRAYGLTSTCDDPANPGDASANPPTEDGARQPANGDNVGGEPLPGEESQGQLPGGGDGGNFGQGSDARTGVDPAGTTAEGGASNASNTPQVGDAGTGLPTDPLGIANANKLASQGAEAEKDAYVNDIYPVEGPNAAADLANALAQGAGNAPAINGFPAENGGFAPEPTPDPSLYGPTGGGVEGAVPGAGGAAPGAGGEIAPTEGGF